MEGMLSQSRQDQPRRSSGPGGMLILAVFLGLLFIAGPHFVEIPTESKVILNIFGAGLLFLGGILTVITRLYNRTAADEAFVRTGMGGAKPVIDGGALVIPVVHETIWMSLRTMRFEVKRKGPDALLTADNLRADITVEFFVKIPKDPDAVKNAATSLGAAASSQAAIQEVVEKKLESAIRGVAATMVLENLMRKRDEFIQSVLQHTQQDIQQNGLVLETVTISQLDQTPTESLRDDNIFDAQGKRKIAEITTAQRVETTKITQEGEQRIAEQTTTTKKLVAEQEVLQAEAEANREKEIKIKQATAHQLAATAEAEQERLSQVAGVNRDKAVQLAEVDQAKEVEVANQEREKAAKTAEIAKHQATEVAERQKQIAVANAEKERAEAEALQLGAEALREANDQEVLTVQVKATAEREKQKTVIDAQAEAEKRRVNEQVVADVAAYTQEKNAEGEKKAAQLRAEARTTLAQAESKAKALEATGEQALQMVPVEVSREQVTVKAAEVDVERTRLENQSAHQEIAKELQIALAQIEAGKEVQIAQAQAFGTALGSANMTIWGDPTTAARMTEGFFRGQMVGQTLNGFKASAPEEITGGLSQIAEYLTQFLKGKGLPVSQDQVETVLKEAQEKVAAATAETSNN